ATRLGGKRKPEHASHSVHVEQGHGRRVSSATSHERRRLQRDIAKVQIKQASRPIADDELLAGRSGFVGKLVNRVAVTQAAETNIRVRGRTEIRQPSLESRLSPEEPHIDAEGPGRGVGWRAKLESFLQPVSKDSGGR